MPDVSGFSALDVFIGLAFVYFLLSTVISALTEAVAGVFQLRWKTLRRGLGELLLHPEEELEALRKRVDDLKKLLPAGGAPLDAQTAETAKELGLVSTEGAANLQHHARSAEAQEGLKKKIDTLEEQLTQQMQRRKKWSKSWDELQKDPRIQALFKQTGVFGGRGPSYIPPRVFVLTMLDTLAPSEAGKHDVISQAKRLVDSATCPPALKAWLKDALAEAGNRRDKMLESVEKSFDGVMDRVSGWYKRTSTIWVFVFAVAVVGALNVDSYAIGQQLWKDQAVRSALVAQAGDIPSSTDCPDATQKTQDAGKNSSNQASGSQPSTNPYDRIANCVDKVKQLGLPFGWASDNRGHSTSEWVAKAGGWMITVLALSLGAPFWFDTLGKLARLRTTGKREGTTKDDDRAPVDRDER